MINGNRAIAIIPARGGSKGLPGKNVRPLCGKPLIGWTIEQARRSRHVDEVLVSTDSREIAEVSRRFGANVPFLRPAELATDVSATIDVVRHALDFYRSADLPPFEYVALLEPTSPLREHDDVDRMLEALHARASEFDSVVSVGQVGEHPSIIKSVVNGRIEPFCPSLMVTTRRQDNLPAFFPFGVGYVVKTAALLDEGTFYTRRCAAFPIKRYQNYEIDDLYDFLCVEAVMKYQWGTP